MKMLYCYLLLNMISLASFTTYAAIDWESNTSYYYQASNKQKSISQQTAIAIAQQHVKGRVLAINRVDAVFRIKILSAQGSVHVVTVSAVDGTVLSSH